MITLNQVRLAFRAARRYEARYKASPSPETYNAYWSIEDQAQALNRKYWQEQEEVSRMQLTQLDVAMVKEGSWS